MAFINWVHSAADGIFRIVNQSLAPCDIKCLSISIVEYKLKAIWKPSLAVDPCCVCQKEFSRQIRIAAKAAKEGVL